MIKAVKKDIELLAEIDSRVRDENRIDIWWLGQSGYLIHWNGRRIVLDPYLSDSLTHKYRDTDKPHVRMSELVASPDTLTGIHLITASHAHTDHLDPQTLTPMLAINPDAELIIPESHRTLASSQAGCEVSKPIGMDIGDIYTTKEITITAVPAAHESLDKDADGHALYLGYIIRLGPWTLYHSGDTIIYPDMVDILRTFPIDICFLPINGADPVRKVAGNMNATEAIWLGTQLPNSLIIPGHYHMFEFNSVEPDEFVHLAKKNRINYKVMSPGELLSLSKSEASRGVI